MFFSLPLLQIVGLEWDLRESEKDNSQVSTQLVILQIVSGATPQDGLYQIHASYEIREVLIHCFTIVEKSGSPVYYFLDCRAKEASILLVE